MSDSRKTWEDRWEGSEIHERITPVGRMMFCAKKRVLTEAMGGLEARTVLEVGCGLGHTLRVFKELGYEASGIDIAPSAVAVCKRKGLTAALKAVEDTEGAYDLVSSDGMLEHFLNFEPPARHLMRLSSRYVLLIQPNHGSFMGLTAAFLATLLRGHENVFEYNYRIKDFADVFEKNGFRMIRSEPIFMDVFRLLVFKRSDPTP